MFTLKQLNSGALKAKLVNNTFSYGKVKEKSISRETYIKKKQWEKLLHISSHLYLCIL